MMRKKYLTMGCALLLALAAMGAQAGIIASATRMIFREGDTENPDAAQHQRLPDRGANTG